MSDEITLSNLLKLGFEKIGDNIYELQLNPTECLKYFYYPNHGFGCFDHDITMHGKRTPLSIKFDSISEIKRMIQ